MKPTKASDELRGKGGGFHGDTALRSVIAAVNKSKLKTPPMTHPHPLSGQFISSIQINMRDV